MVTGDLPFDPAVVAVVGEIMVRERGAGWAWSHKTGTARAEQPALGWLVGTTDHDDRNWVFAMNVDLSSTAPGVQVDERVRQTVSRRILEEVGALPSP